MTTNTEPAIADHAHSPHRTPGAPTPVVQAPVTRGRDIAVDALRALAILAVVLDHAILAAAMNPQPQPGFARWGLVTIGFVPRVYVPDTIYHSVAINILYALHVPLFAFVSGYVIRVSSAMRKGFVKQRAIRLMLPYIAWLTIALALGTPTFKWFWSLWPRGLTEMHIQGALWFLYALFGASLLFRAALGISSNRRFLLLTAVATIVVYAFPGLPYFLRYADVLRLYPFLVAGHVLSRSPKALETLRRPTIWVSAGVFGVALAAATWPLMQPAQNFIYTSGIPLVSAVAYSALRFASTLCSIGFLWGAIRLVPQGALKAMSWLGTRTIGIYASHSLLIGPLYLAMGSLQPYALRLMIVFAGSFIGSVIITVVAEKTAPSRLILLGEPPKPGRPIAERPDCAA